MRSFHIKIIFICSLLFNFSTYVNTKPNSMLKTPDHSKNYSQQTKNEQDVVRAKENLKHETLQFNKELLRTKNILEKSNQLLIVTSKDWDSTTASLTCYERRKGKLLKIGETIPVNLGRSGLGWGMGIVDFNSANAPVKKEGDGRSPAGIFKLSYAFGYLPKDSVSWLRFPYKQLTSDIECVDDTSSQYYNTLVSNKEVRKKWNSSEMMKRKDDLYKYGIFVEHDSNPPRAGCGSCIFIHIWEGFGDPTSGCTSMSEENLIKLLHWIDVKKKPLLIQMPQKEFDKIKNLLRLNS